MKTIIIAVTAALIAATASTAFADEFDPNLANRYPAYNEPAAAPAQGLRSAQVSLTTRTDAVTQRAPQWNDVQVYPQSPSGFGGF